MSEVEVTFETLKNLRDIESTEKCRNCKKTVYDIEEIGAELCHSCQFELEV